MRQARTYELNLSAPSFSSDYDKALNAAYSLGQFHAQHGKPRNSQGLYGSIQQEYHRGYRSAEKVTA